MKRCLEKVGNVELAQRIKEEVETRANPLLVHNDESDYETPPPSAFQPPSRYFDADLSEGQQSFAIKEVADVGGKNRKLLLQSSAVQEPAGLDRNQMVKTAAFREIMKEALSLWVDKMDDEELANLFFESDIIRGKQVVVATQQEPVDPRKALMKHIDAVSRTLNDGDNFKYAVQHTVIDVSMVGDGHVLRIDDWQFLHNVVSFLGSSV